MPEKKKNKANSFNQAKKIFIIALVIGLQLAFMFSYLYLMYRDLIKAEGEIPDTITYQGKIINDNGVPPPDGDYNMKFVIYNQATGGNVLWTEFWDNSTREGIQAASGQVGVKDGVFSVELNSLCQNWVGTCSSNGGVTFSNASFYLEVQLDYDGDDIYEEIFSPRKRFTAIPFAMNSDKLDGLDSTDFILKAGDKMEGDLTVPTLIADKIIDSSLVASYEFNGDEKDSGPNQLNGVIQNSALVANQVLELNGIDQYVLVPDDDILSFIDNDSNLDSGLTFSAWLNLTDAADFNLLSKGIFNSNAEYRFFINNNYKLELRLYDESVPDCYIGRLYDALDFSELESQWVNVVATYDGSGSSGGIKLYLNGNFLNTVASELNAVSYVSMENLNANLHIGRYDDNYANGKLDNIIIYNRPLADDEIKRLYGYYEKHTLQAGNIIASGLNLYALGDEDGVKELKAGNLVWDAIYNRFKFDSEIYAPNTIPYFNNSVQDRDYTYISDPKKVLAYDFNESIGDTVYDLESNANAILYGDVSWTNQGYIGYGLEFDGEEDYLDIASSLTGVMSSEKGSIEMWIRLKDIASSKDNYLIRLAELTTNEISIYKRYTDLSNLADLYFSVGNSGPIDTGWDFTDNNWHHIVLVYNNNDVDVFVDGGYVYSEKSVYSALDVSRFSSLYLGSRTISGTNSLNGYMDSVAIYNDILTPEEIINHYHAAFHNLYLANNISDATINTTLDNLYNFSASNNNYNKIDPVYFSNPQKSFALSFYEGRGDTVSSVKYYGFGFDKYNYNLKGALNGGKWIRDGYYGYGLEFDGIGDNIIFAHSDDTEGDFDFGTDNFSVEFWMKGAGSKETNDNEGKRIISKRDGDVGFEVYLEKEDYGDAFDRIVFFIGDGVNTVSAYPETVDMSDGEWRHVIISFDRDSGEARIIRDATQISSIDISSVTGSISNSGDLYIASDSTSNYFKGALDSLIFYKGVLLSDYDGYNRFYNSPEIFVASTRNLHNAWFSQAAPILSLNLSDYGQGAILGIEEQNNTTGFPLALWTDAYDSNSIYNLISFSNTTVNPSPVDFGNLKWDAGNSKFILSQSLAVSGDLEANFIKTDSNELLAHDVIRHTLTSGQASANTFSVSWNKASRDKIVSMTAVTLDISSNLVIANDWGNLNGDCTINYDGSSITVVEQVESVWAENDIVTIYIVYEK